jgi:hypothetical protein
MVDGSRQPSNLQSAVGSWQGLSALSLRLLALRQAQGSMRLRTPDFRSSRLSVFPTFGLSDLATPVYRLNRCSVFVVRCWGELTVRLERPLQRRWQMAVRSWQLAICSLQGLLAFSLDLNLSLRLLALSLDLNLRQHLSSPDSGLPTTDYGLPTFGL